MPYAKPRRTRTRRPNRKPSGVRKRTYTKRRTIFRPQRLLQVGFPKTNMVKLRYVDGFYLNPTSGFLAYQDISANDCNVPKVTGHQPMNFDQWAALYNHYVVVGAKITATFHNGNVTEANGYVCGINLQDDGTMSTNATTVMEQGLTRYKMGNSAMATYSGKGPTVSKSFSAKKFFNITNVTDNFDRIGAPVSASPTEKAHFLVFYGAAPANGGDLGAVAVTVRVDYIVIFSEPKEQPQS